MSLLLVPSPTFLDVVSIILLLSTGTLLFWLPGHTDITSRSSGHPSVVHATLTILELGLGVKMDLLPAEGSAKVDSYDNCMTVHCATSK